MPWNRRVVSLALWSALLSFLLQPTMTPAQVRAGGEATKVLVEADGTVEAPAQTVPISSYLSPEAKTYVTEHLKQMRDPEMTKPGDGMPLLLRPYLARDKAIFAVDRKDQKLAGVHVYVYTPNAGIADRNKHRVLMNLHGGGFSGCRPGCAELEFIPVSALGQIQVVSIDYREGPENRFPAASEDVASVYQELLKTHKPKDIGIYGCSAGGMQTDMSVAWFQTHSLPTPGAIGILCASAGGVLGGDSSYTVPPLGEAHVPSPMPVGTTNPGYFKGTDPNDPLIAPLNSPEIIARFPPTLIITGTRSFELSAAVHTHTQLVKSGVDAELHVWEGLFHGFFYNVDVPESRDAFNVIIKFFDRHLGEK
jgi:monoterpene epsilon-lactone hydrolase